VLLLLLLVDVLVGWLRRALLLLLVVVVVLVSWMVLVLCGWFWSLLKIRWVGETVSVVNLRFNTSV
jgi:hypothetical protein